MHTKILVYSNDAILLLTRRQILEREGFRVFTTLEFSDAVQLILNQEIALVILCQSLKADQRQGILATIRASQPQMKIIVMEPDELSTLIEPHKEYVNALTGPQFLLDAINKMLQPTVIP